MKRRASESPASDGEQGSVPVLMYHAVGSPMPAGLEELSVEPSLVRDQLAALRDAGYELLGLTDALAAAAQGRRVAAVTFDDGFVDFVEHGLRVLADVGAKATLYVPSRAIGGTARWISHGPEAPAIVDESQIHEVAEAGMEIGSHGAEHVPMDVLDGRVAAQHLGESRDVLEQVSAGAVVSMCYPHGYHSRALRRSVAAAGFRNACAIGHRRHSLAADPLAVQRLLVGPHHDPAAVIDLVTHGPSQWPPRVKRVLTPSWRIARRVALRTGGRTWT